MNIFVLDNDMDKCVKYYVDKHVVKMILETSQILCTTHHLTNETANKIVPYRATHKNHPCTIWARQSLSNYNWLVKLGLAICKEYTHRYEKIHKCQAVIEKCRDFVPNIPDIGLTPFVQAMPDKYKCDDVVQAYRNYYKGEKQHLFAWKKRNKPEWI